jgi:hypothetical protein
MRRLLFCRRGSALIGYTSLMLLLAVAAIAVLGHAGGGERLHHTRITSD